MFDVLSDCKRMTYVRRNGFFLQLCIHEVVLHLILGNRWVE